MPGALVVCRPFRAFVSYSILVLSLRFNWPEMAASGAKRGGAAREGSSVCEANLREVQGHQAQGRCDGHLREPQAQAEAGLAQVV